MEKFIITCNAGSSNIKLAKYNAHTLELREKLKVATPDEVLTWYKAQNAIIAIAHRVVHGGKKFTQPVVIDQNVLKELQKLEVLAPLHQPLALSIISSLMDLNHTIPHVACFDTSFHRLIPEMEKLFPLPYIYFEEGICRYGFHGLSYDYIASVLPNIAGKHAEGKVIVLHLGSGSSICGIVNLKSQAISMGFSALDGLMMGSRSGTIDPGAILYFLKQKAMDVTQLEELLYHKSGLKGVSNISHDVKVLEDNGSQEAHRALQLYCYSAAKYIGAIACAIGGVDCVVFTGGVGENSSSVRRDICSYLTWLGLAIDNNANTIHAGKISSHQSSIPVYVIPTDEEMIMVKNCVSLISS
jgi:acetate kinase